MNAKAILSKRQIVIPAKVGVREFKFSEPLLSRERLFQSFPNRQYGFSIVAAIFILVILALLGGFMVTIGVSQRTTVAYAVQGARAYQAARSGIEWGVSRVINNAPGTSCALAPATTVTGPFALSGAGLDGFRVTVECTYTQHQEGSTPYEVFAITSKAEFGTFSALDPYYFSRTVQVSVTNAQP